MENKTVKNNVKTMIYNLIILDKSGSMSSIANAAIGGFNETIGSIRSAQKQYSDTQEHYVSLLPFCGCSMDYVYDCTPIDKVKKLTSRNYEPCCCTPLYDAMGKGINDLLKKTKDNKEAVVIVTIITDGLENASQEYSGKAIKALVDKMRDDYGWNFAYIGTNQDVESVATSLSITNTIYFEDTEEGMDEAWDKERKSRNRMFSRLHSFCCEAAPMSADMHMSALHNLTRNNKNYQEFDEFAHRVTPDKINHLKEGQIFVFGSNAMGHHGGGAAYTAMQKFGAIYGQGDGLQGQSYAISTMEGMEPMRENVDRFIKFAKQHPELTFLVTRIGCGIAGYEVREVAPLFTAAVDVENIWLPKDFWQEII